MSRGSKFRYLLLATVAVLLGFLTFSPAFTQAAGSPGPVGKVDEAMKKGLPQTAIKELEPIIAEAQEAKAWAEAVKAIGLKIALEGNIQGNKAEERITRMQAAVAKAPEEMKPVMHAILAHWYWQYFQQNRWRIVQRTETTGAADGDVTTWSLPRIIQEIDAQLDLALANRKLIEKTKVEEFDPLLVKGSMPDRYRPTMYDFLVHEALDFYKSGESFVTKPEDDFEISAAGPVFGTVDEFLAWKIEDSSDSRHAKALRLYQDLLRFHADDQEPTARLAADLGRLELGNSYARGEEKEVRYIVALKRFIAAHREHELASVAHYNWAVTLRQQDELVEAHQVATAGKNLHPASVGGKQCHNLLLQIEAKSFQLTTERVWNAPLPTIDVTYKNISKLHFRLVAMDWAERTRTTGRRAEYLYQPADRQRILAATPAKAWSVDLKPTPDYQQRTAALSVPEDLPPGFYFLVASHNKAFSASDNQVIYTDVWVSDLALITRQQSGDLELSGFVLDAKSGKPISGATAQVWTQERNKITPGQTVKTNAEGLFRFDGAGIERKNSLVLVTKDKQQLVTANDYHLYKNNRNEVRQERTVFFTDRALYRPGQTIQFKGLCYAVAQHTDTYEVLKNRKVKVIFQDVNGEKIAELQQQTNDYGSFAGSFTAPRDRVMGRMSIRVDGTPSGAVQVSVEEYKRPKFQVELAAPTKAPELKADVELIGTATAYNGAPIDGAKVRWRVVRQVRFPDWWYWYRGWYSPQRESQEIAHGTATSDVDGKFTITFTAKPDESIDPKSEPVFQFAVTADVTDTAGETRSADRSIQIGYHARQAKLTADDWQTEAKPVEIKVSISSLDGAGRPGEGTVKIHALTPPAAVHRPDLQPGRRYHVHRGAGANGENEADPDLSDPKNWPLGEVVAEREFVVGESGTTTVSAPLKVGAYQAVLTTHDQLGAPITARLAIKVIDPTADHLALKIPFLFAASTWTYEPGSTFKAVWGSGYDQAQAYVEVEHREKILQAFWTDPRKTQLEISQEITEEMRGGFTVRVTMVRENRAFIETRHVDVPWSNKQLEVKWERFVSKLKPGAEETWTAVITGPDAKRAVAEMVATLYDASLDAYLPHNWMHGFGVFRRDQSRLYSRFENNSKGFNHLQGYWTQNYQGVAITYRSFPAQIVGLLYGHQWFAKDKNQAAAPGLGAAGGGFGRQMRAGFAEAQGGALSADHATDGLARKASANRADAKNLQQAAGQGKAEGGRILARCRPRKNLSKPPSSSRTWSPTKDGEVRIEFTMPEALTEWKFMGFAHDTELRSGYLQDTVVTSKDLMVQPNPPRFVREGGLLEFTVKVTNQVDTCSRPAPCD